VKFGNHQPWVLLGTLKVRCTVNEQWPPEFEDLVWGGGAKYPSNSFMLLQVKMMIFGDVGLIEEVWKFISPV
jgi:hypothetical protein